jgi:hypothetical protein
MHKIVLVLSWACLLALPVLAQNVGIGETTPAARLTVKGSGLNSSLLVKNANDDSLLLTGNRNLHLGGYHQTSNGVVVISNKHFLPTDPAQLQLVAAGERTGGNAAGSLNMIRFSNVNSDKYFYQSSYTGSDETLHSFSLNYLNPALAISQTLLYIKPNGQTGIGTWQPAGKLQVNHRSSIANATLNLYDSVSNGVSILQFNNGGGSNYWQLRGSANNVSPNTSSLDFATANGVQMTLRGNGNLGLGVAIPTETLDVDGNIKTTGEVNRPATGASNLVPICYGNVSGTGTINSSSGNFSVSKISTGWYAITITGESYQFQTYTVVITPVTGPAMVASGSGGGNLYVYTYNGSGTAADNQFCFTVYKQ